jgi:diguanylate cyclase (GGDEF)-like protein
MTIEATLDAVPVDQRVKQPAAEQAVPALKASVMVLLDDAANAGLLGNCLQDMGYRNVLTAETLVAARQRLLNDHPDLLLLDADFPADGGLELLSWMRSDKTLKNTLVIVLSDAGDTDLKLRALELGAADFLAKPVDARELALRMRNMLVRTTAGRATGDEDALTGLTNRHRFNTVLEWALTYAKRMNVVGAVLQIGVDRFAQVNEALGPGIGDLLLQAVARRLMECVRGMDVVSSAADGASSGDFGVSLSRIGGDEFSILLPVIQRAEQAAIVALRIRSALAAPFQIAGHDLIVTCCVGIAVFPADGANRDEILGHAGVAMKHAKQQGRDRHEFYGEEMNKRSLQRLALERDLRQALDRREFSLVYQAKVGVKSGRLSGAEALLRWRHPERGWVSPMDFIPIAEDIDLITPLGEWVFRDACRQIVAWKTAGIATPRISVNVSAKQMHHAGFEKSIRQALLDANLDGRGIVLELTESALMQDPDRAVALLKSLRETGLGVSIDDFGTGYSSLAYLRRFPLDELKIDRSFLAEANADSVAIVSAIIALAHSLRLSVVAEGVEHERQLEFLRSRNCDEYQGYFFSKPVAAEVFEVIMRTGKPPRT